jgi:hypothetical protein
MKITLIEYIPIDEDNEVIKFTREHLFSKSYLCLIGSNRYKRVGKILSSMKEADKLNFLMDSRIGNESNLLVSIGYNDGN